MATSLKNLNSKIIGITGSPGSGKTTLASMFMDFDNAIVIQENVTEFPEFILKNLRSKTKLFETILWFRNKQVKDFLLARSWAKKNYTVIIESTFYQYQQYIDHYISDEPSREILRATGDLDNLLITPPDILIYLSLNKKNIKTNLFNKGEAWPLYSVELIDYLSEMVVYSEQFVKTHTEIFPNLIEVDRSLYDFSRSEDFSWLLQRINNIIS
ncbi:AAA family ATPase [Pedobacter sp. PF22-3]|uniref:AAA family ATPase n=1 Tax=Pedobacter sp. PF22-3 TaxID=2994467 RepID=UPI002245A303|nr:AAA family ATPase [Pedobacter sp. PF22-3]MCX2492852.1 AAA family ATPase [Pedobacter sp. PF22-3]